MLYVTLVKITRIDVVNTVANITPPLHGAVIFRSRLV